MCKDMHRLVSAVKSYVVVSGVLRVDSQAVHTSM
jgi:hypothetical protein